MLNTGLNFVSAPPKIPTANSGCSGEWPKESTGQTGRASQIQGGRGHLQSSPTATLEWKINAMILHMNKAGSIFGCPRSLDNPLRSSAGNYNSCTNCQRCTNPKSLNARLCPLCTSQPTSIPSTKPEFCHPWWAILFHNFHMLYRFYSHAGLAGRWDPCLKSHSYWMSK